MSSRRLSLTKRLLPTHRLRQAMVIALVVLAVAPIAVALLGGPVELARALIVVCCVVAIGVSLFAPAVASGSMIAMFLYVMLYKELASFVLIIAAIIVLGAIAYTGRYLLTLGTAVALLFLGSVDIARGSLDVSVDGTGFFFAALLFAGGAGVGAVFGMNARKRHAEKLELEEERQRRREATVRTLHDSVASSLTSAIMRAEGLGFEGSLPDELQSSVNGISRDIREAMKEIRVLIDYANTDEWPEPDASELNAAPSEMVSGVLDSLRGHGFEVAQKGSCEVLDQLDVGRRQLRLIFSELVANSVKYGDRDQPIECAVGAERGAVIVTLSNGIAGAQSATYLSSGIGIQDIEASMAELGGAFDYGAAGSRWISTLRFPLRKVDTFVPTSEIFHKNS